MDITSDALKACGLTEREIIVWQAFFVDKKTIRDIAKQIGVTFERIEGHIRTATIKVIG